jgi:LuxR family transcriptional regulator, maltose regulon positive regulatory protein
VKQGCGPRLGFCWLGHPRVEVSGCPVRLETRKVTALLAYLSLSEHPQSREKLAALFWPEFDSSRAPANLRRGLASLHASIPGDWLEADRDRIGVRKDADLWIDVLAARRCVADIKAHSHDSDEACPGCVTFAGEAITLFHGEFLEGFTLPDCPGFDDWQTAERESLRAELGWLLERSARGLAAAERWEEAFRSAKRLLAQDRMHEQAQALMIRILVLSGQRSAAVRQYEEYAELLRAEFGQEPEKATRDLYNQVLSRQIGPRVKADDAPPGGPKDGGAQPGESKEPPAPRPVARSADLVPGLLGTKLSVPPVREGLVRRRRLTRLLEQGLERGLVIVSAPAGFGKTTILSELAAQGRVPVAWLSLDEGDNDLSRFLLHLAGSIVRTEGGIGEEAIQMLQAMPPAPAELVMTALINAVQERGQGIALVLDDYQFIQAMEVHAAVRFLIDHRPASLGIFIAARADPPFPLARLRSQGRVTEIRAEDLRFTAAEAGQFFDRAMSLSLSAAQVAVLERRTEGWVAGLQMAGLSLQGRNDVDDFIASFGGTHRYILDYLAEEVLSRQDDELKQFLLDTSILARMSAGLCEAVTGRSGCQELLRRLERMNLFLVPLDEQRTWYRYHHLFADLLRHKRELERLPGKVHELHLKAGDWLAGQGELIEAIQEYLGATAHEKAADLIEARFFDIVSQGALSQLQRVCRDIPSEVLEKRPGYCVAAAWTLAMAGRRRDAEALLDRVELRISGARPSTATAPAGKDSGSVRILEGGVAAVRAFLADMAGETGIAVELARKAERLLPPRDDLPRTVILYILARSHLDRGELEEAEQGLDEQLRASHATGSIFSVCAAVSELARLRGLQGRRRDGEALLEDFDALAARRHAQGTGPIAKAYSVLAEFKRERGALDEALRIAEKAAKDVDAWGLPSDVYLTHQFLARVLRSCGQLERAQEEIEKVRLLPQRALVWATLLPTFEADRVKVFLARGDIASAEASIREHSPGKAETAVNREVELVSMARVRLAAGATGEPLAEVSNLLRDMACAARTGGRNGPLMAILLLQAKAKASLSEEKDALAALDEAVRLAQPEGYFRIFVEEGPQMRELLRRGLESGMWCSPPVTDYVGGLISAFSG